MGKLQGIVAMAGASRLALVKDIWRVGIVRASAQDVLSAGGVDDASVAWLPPEGALRFLADPFGLWRDGELFLFAEAYDYRTRVGWIDVLRLNARLEVAARDTALREPWHLSYPFVFEAEGETWMLPEAFKSGRLTLYRAVDFPTRWEPAATLPLDAVAIDATPVFRDGLWWLFYTPAATKADKVSALHVAFAETLRGPWRAHPANPVRYDRAGARPGGRPVVLGERLILPVQDCSRTYGGGLRPLEITRLTTTAFEAEVGASLRPPSDAGRVSGFHTLSACGEVSLIDVKRQVVTPESIALDVARAIRRRRQS